MQAENSEKQSDLTAVAVVAVSVPVAWDGLGEKQQME